WDAKGSDSKPLPPPPRVDSRGYWWRPAFRRLQHNLVIEDRRAAVWLRLRCEDGVVGRCFCCRHHLYLRQAQVRGFSGQLEKMAWAEPGAGHRHRRPVSLAEIPALREFGTNYVSARKKLSSVLSQSRSNSHGSGNGRACLKFLSVIAFQYAIITRHNNQVIRRPNSFSFAPAEKFFSRQQFPLSFSPV